MNDYDVELLCLLRDYDHTTEGLRAFVAEGSLKLSQLTGAPNTDASVASVVSANKQQPRPVANLAEKRASIGGFSNPEQQRAFIANLVPAMMMFGGGLEFLRACFRLLVLSFSTRRR